MKGVHPFPPQNKGGSPFSTPKQRGFTLYPPPQSGERSPVPGGEACSQPLPGIKTGFSGHSPSEGSLGERDSAGRQLPLVGEEKKREGKKKSKKKKGYALGCAAGMRSQMCCTAGTRSKPRLGLSPKGFDNLNSSLRRIRMNLPICPEMETSVRQGYFFTSPNNDLLLFGAEIGCFPAVSFPQILGFQSLLSL